MSDPLTTLAEKVRAGQELHGAEVDVVAGELLGETASVDQKAAFLRDFAAKGETPGEIAAFVDAFLARAVDPGLNLADLDGPAIDVCGTGGDKLNLFNVSTTCIFILAAAGATVVKHGNRGITSKSGGADVLEALGVRIDLKPADFAECVKRTGLGFLFAPNYHPAFKAVVPVRQQLAKDGVRTVFNILGPLLNPVRPPHQLVGVFSPELPAVFAEILAKLGRKCAWAVHGTTAEGAAMDELSTLGPTKIAKTRDGQISAPEEIFPADFGFAKPDLSQLTGGDAPENAAILTAILDGAEKGPKRDLMLLNSAAGLVVSGLAPNLEVGVSMAAEQIDNGRALAKLNALQKFPA